MCIQVGLNRKFEVMVTESQVNAFAAFSHDYNSMHCDRGYARKTAFGEPICFGSLAVISLLVECPEVPPICLRSLTVNFVSAIFINRAYQGCIAIAEDTVDITLSDEDKVLIHCRFRYHDQKSEVCSAIPSVASMSASIGFAPLKKPQYPSLDELCLGSKIEIQYCANYEAWKDLCGELGMAEGGNQLAPIASILGLSSYWVGMHIPGQQALFSTVTLSIVDISLAVGQWDVLSEVNHIDKNFSLIQQQLNVTHEKKTVATVALDAFFRPPPVEINIEKLIEYSAGLSSAMTGKTILVVGASRGLGASISCIAALSGAKVFANYANSKHALDALRDRLPESARGGLMPLQGDCRQCEFINDLASILRHEQSKIDSVYFCATPSLQTIDPDSANGRAFQEYLLSAISMVTTPLSAIKSFLADDAKMTYVSSQVIHHAVQDWPHYSAAKASIESLWKTLALKHSKKHWYIVRPPQLATDLVSSPIPSSVSLSPELAASLIVDFVTYNAVYSGDIAVMDDFSVEHAKRRKPTDESSGDSLNVFTSMGHPVAMNVDNTMHQSDIKRSANYISMASSFTLDPIEDKLQFWLEQAKIENSLDTDLQIRLAPYNQGMQSLLMPDSLFYGDKGKLNVLLLRMEDCLHYDPHWEALKAKDLSVDEYEKPNIGIKIGEQLAQWIDALRHFRAQTPLLIFTCHDSGVLSGQHDYEQIKRQWVEEFDQVCASSPGLYHKVLRQPEFDDYDAMRNKMAHIPFDEAGYLHLATEIFRGYCALTFSPIKAIVCDCDNTLWHGIVGEDGVDGVVFDPGHLALQKKLVDLVSKGFLVFLCSKNNEADVLSVFHQRKEMKLRLKDVAGYRINWQPKSDNMRSLATELNLGLDSFVFLDDNPMEIEEVAQALPMVLGLCVRDSRQLLLMIDAFWFSDRLHLSAEDYCRTKMYQDNKKRQDVRAEKTSLISFIKTLDIRTDIQMLQADQIVRVAQLSNKTNQFNFTTLRLGEREVGAYIKDSDKCCWAVTVEDKFGCYGLVGAMFCTQVSGQWQLDNLLLSCRVLGRGVEYELLNKLGAEYVRTTLFRILYVPSSKNQLAFEFLSRAFPGKIADRQQICELDVDPQDLASLEMVENAGLPIVRETKLKSAPPCTANILSQHHLYARIASELNSFSVIQDAYRKHMETRAEDVANGLPNDVGTDKKNVVSAATGHQTDNKLWLSIKEAFQTALPFLKVELSLKTEFSELNLSSLMMVNLTVALSKNVGLPLSATYMYGLNRLTDLRVKLQQDLGILNPSMEKPVASNPGALTPVDRNRFGRREKIAIVGVAGRYPGADNLAELWELLRQGHCRVSDVPKSRWDHQQVFSSLSNQLGKSCSSQGGFISQHDCFDEGLFNISPKDAALMDPQQRWFLTIAYECILNAGYNKGNVGTDTGVFAGAMAKDYQLLCANLVSKGEAPFPYAELYQIANRVSYFFDLTGPSMTLDTACSSSGVAIHMASEAILNGECSQALAGGVNLILDPQRYIQYSQMGMLSPDGRCRTFSNDAKGMVMGEGVGCVLLKPLSKAEADGDYIYATLLASHSNSGGRTSGFTVPNPEAQAQLIRRVIDKAKIDPDSISYIETHGTGTPLGDPIEVDGIGNGLDRKKTLHGAGSHERRTRKKIKLGSIKSNIGHLEPAAAIAGLTKVVQQLQHQTLVPSLNSEPLSGRIDFEQYGLDVQKDCQPWQHDFAETPRRAGVSSFGAGGVNAHLLVEEYVGSRGIPGESGIADAGTKKLNSVIIPLSARTKNALAEMVRQLALYLTANPGLKIESIAHTLQIGRDKYRHRLALISASTEALLAQLQSWLADDSSVGISGDGKQYKGLEELLTDSYLLVDHWLLNQQLDRVASLWVSGGNVDWTRAYQEANVPHKLPLPGYPFMGTRHWLDGAKWQATDDERRPVSDAAVSRSICLNCDDYFIADHGVNDQVILPAVSYLALFADFHSFTAMRIEQLLWLKPLVFSKGQQKNVFVRSEDQSYLLQDDRGKNYAKCQSVKAIVEKDESYSTFVDILTLKNRFSNVLGQSDCYQRLIRQGFNYGPGLQAIEQIWYTDDHDEPCQALAYIRRPQSANNEVWRLCSALLDAGLQTAIVFNNADQALLPYACDYVDLFSLHWPDQLYCLVKLGRSENHRLTCDIKFVDEDGQVLLYLHQLTLLANTHVHSAGPLNTGNNLKTVDDAQHNSVTASASLYTPQWQTLDAEISKTQVYHKLDKLLILADDQDSAKAIENRLIQARNPVFDIAEIFIILAPTVQDIDLYVQRHANTDDQRLLVIDLVSASDQHMENLFPVRVCQGLRCPTGYLVVWIGEHAMGDAYAGLGLSLGHETDKKGLKTLKASCFEALNAYLAHVLVASQGTQFQATRHSLKYLAAVPIAMEASFQTESKRASEPQSKIGFKVGGVYWFTGLGGIALTLAKELIARFDAHIIFSGRRRKEDTLLSLAELPSASVEYYQLDISLEEDCRRVWVDLQGKHRAVHGIIHSAGTVNDQRLQAQPLENFRQVLVAKIAGTKNVLSLVDHACDTWVILCSSIASVIGNAGQSSYAMANKYLDATAVDTSAKSQWQGRILSINWPLWQDTGMANGGSGLVAHNRRLGLDALKPEDGFDHLQRLIQCAASHAQLIYLLGNSTEIESLLTRVTHTQALVAESVFKESPIDVISSVTRSSGSVREALLTILFQHTTQLLDLPEDVVEADEDLSDYGFDSISLADFAERLNRQFALGLTPVIFFDHPSLGALADALLVRYGASLATQLHCTSDSDTVAIDTPQKRLHLSTSIQNDVISTLSTPVNAESIRLEVGSVQTGKIVSAIPVNGRTSDQERDKNVEKNEPIAIIGLACRFPQSENSLSFWQNLVAGKNLIQPIPAQRFSKNKDDKGRPFQAGLVPGIDEFDPSFFQISLREAILMDPQHRLLLELAWHAIEQAGYQPKQLAGQAIGVFTAVTLHDHLERLHEVTNEAIAHLATGNVHCLSANRISYLLDLKGPSEAIDTACSSSLVALNRAVKALRNGECKQAIVGGANALLTSTMFDAFSHAGMLSSTGRCHSFSANADGYVRGEGGGALLLKPLAQAQMDGDYVHALIRGTAVNHVGHGHSLTAPSAKSQAQVIRLALNDAQVSANSIGYIEAHGTGTRLGDPIEIEGLAQAFGHESHLGRCYIGTAKTNIGHLESAAGMAGLIKTILAMQHQILPKSLNAEPVNPFIGLADSPFQFLPESRPWQALSGHDGKPLPRRAGVSSFGFGGVNGHVILEEYSANARSKPEFPLTRFNRIDCSPAILQSRGDTAATSRLPSTSLLHYLIPEWQPSPIATIKPDSEAKTILLLVGNQQVLSWLPQIPCSSNLQWVVVRSESQLPHFRPDEYVLEGDPELLLPTRLASVDWVIDALDLHIPSDDEALSVTPSGYRGNDSGQNSPDSVWRVQLLQQLIRLRAGKGLQLMHLSGENMSSMAAWAGCLYSGLSAEYRSVNCYRITFTKEPSLAVLETLICAEMANSQTLATTDKSRIIRYISPADQPHFHPDEASRQELRYVPKTLEFDRSRQPLGKKNGVYLITGGTGAIGLQMASLLANSDVETILLLGRSALSNEHQCALDVLRRSVDTRYFSTLSALETDITNTALNVDGVFHCAGVDTQGELAFVNKTSTSFTACLGPKLELAESLCQLLNRHTPNGCDGLDFFIGFSSVAAVSPVLTAGRSDYGPANAAMDQWILQQAKRYPHGGFVSIQWPSLQSGGMPVIETDLYRDTGLPNLTASQAEALTLAVIQRLSEHASTKSDIVHWLAIGESPVSLRLYPDYSDGATDKQSPSDQHSLNPNWQNRHEDNVRHQDVILALQSLFIERLLSPTSIEIDQSFVAMGIDSILIADLVNAIEKRFQCVLPPSAILEHSTINRLGDYLMSELHVQLPSDHAQPTTKSAAIKQPVIAHMEAKTAAKVSAAGNNTRADKVAIIGLGCRLPGANSVEQYWQNLVSGVNSVIQVPRDRFDLQSLFSKEAHHGQSISQWGGLIDGVDLFDPEYFGIPEEQAAFIDPLTRLSLLTATDAIADAGYCKDDLWGTSTGVFIGGNRAHYGLHHISNPAAATGLNQNFISAYLSHVFNFTGPSMVLDSACSSSLLTIHLAQQQLLSGDIDLAIAGGVEVLLDETPFVKLTASGALSPDGLCHTFSDKANGFVPGEGAGAVVLKRLSDAIVDKDPIYAVIEASAVNNDGNTMGLTTPNVEAQRALLERVYSQRGIAIEQLAYLEAHGTATMIGDPIELKAIATALRQQGASQGQIAIGSVKSNIGHLMGAAGIASFIKIVQVLAHKTVPPTLNCDTPNPRFCFAESPVYPALEKQPLQLVNGRALAGVSAFGFGGTNCHLCCGSFHQDESQPIRARLPKPTFNLRSFWLKDTASKTSITEKMKHELKAPHYSHRRSILSMEEV